MGQTLGTGYRVGVVLQQRCMGVVVSALCVLGLVLVAPKLEAQKTQADQSQDVDNKIQDLRDELEARIDELESLLEEDASPGLLHVSDDLEFRIGGFALNNWSMLHKEGGLGGGSYVESRFTRNELALQINGRAGSRFTFQNFVVIGSDHPMSPAGFFSGRSAFTDFEGFSVADPAGPTQANNFTGVNQADDGFGGGEFFGAVFMLAGTYQFSPLFNLRFGQMPASFADGDLLIYDNLRRAVETPQYTRVLGLNGGVGVSNRVIVENIRGLELNGTLLEEDEWALEYATYAGLPTFTSELAALDSYVFGNRLFADFYSIGLDVGFSYQHSRIRSPEKTDPATGVKVADGNGGQLDTFGLDVTYGDGDFALRGELVFALARARSDNKFSAYIEPSYRVLDSEKSGEMWLYGRIDYFDSNASTHAGQLEDAVDYKLGMFYRLPGGGNAPIVKAEYTCHDFAVNRPLASLALISPGSKFNRRDYHIVTLSLVITF